MNTTMLGFYLWISTGIIGIGLVLALRYRWFLQHIQTQEQDGPQVSMLNDTPSYERYKKIASRHSVKSSPVRIQGDFLDFMLDNKDNHNEKSIECNLSKIDVGESFAQ